MPGPTTRPGRCTFLGAIQRGGRGVAGLGPAHSLDCLFHPDIAIMLPAIHLSSRRGCLRWPRKIGQVVKVSLRRVQVAEFCSARSETIPPLPWTNLSPPFPDTTASPSWPRGGSRSRCPPARRRGSVLDSWWHPRAACDAMLRVTREHEIRCLHGRLTPQAAPNRTHHGLVRESRTPINLELVWHRWQRSEATPR